MRALQYNTNKIEFYVSVMGGDMKKYLIKQLAHIKESSDLEHKLAHSRVVLGVIGKYQGYPLQIA